MAARGITFRVADKEPAAVSSKPAKLDALFSKEQLFAQNAGGEILARSGDDTTQVHRADFGNGFVGACVAAYSRHHNLVLSPDNVWNSILTQLSFYVQARAEELRSVFVDFEGKRELIVRSGGTLRTAPYDELSIMMTDQIAKNIKDASLRDWVMPRFSTTTHTDTTVYAIALMATMQSYFTYKFELCCGIPSVTLLGTVDDWTALAQRIDRLVEFDGSEQLMTKWHALLAPVLQQFVRAAQGDADVEFWNRVASHHGGGSGPRYLSGWITAFCCFDEKGGWQGDQRTVRGMWDGKVTETDWPVINDNDVPLGYVSVPVTVDDNGTVYSTRMFAGSLAVDVDAAAPTTVAPRADWCIALVDEKAVAKAAEGRY